MNKNSILLVNPNYNPADNHQYKLIIQVGLNTISYLILDDNSNQIHALYDEQECINTVEILIQKLKNDPYLQYSFKTVLIAIQPENCIFVPSELYLESEIKNYTKYFVDKHIQEIIVDNYSKQQYNAVFSISKQIDTAIKNKWDNAVITIHNTGFFNMDFPNVNENLIIDFTVGTFQLIYFKNNQLNISQSYTFDNLDELMYFVLLAVKELKINTDEVKLYLSGIIHPEDEKWKMFKQHFNHIELLTVSVPYQSDILEDMPLQYYSSILSLI